MPTEATAHPRDAPSDAQPNQLQDSFSSRLSDMLQPYSEGYGTAVEEDDDGSLVKGALMQRAVAYRPLLPIR